MPKMRTTALAAGFVALSALPASAFNYPFGNDAPTPLEMFGSSGYAVGDEEMSFDTVQFIEGACAIGSLVSIAVPAAGFACIPSQLIGLGQMFQPQRSPPRQYAEAPPRRRSVRNSGPQPARYASRDTGENEERRFERLLNAHLERHNLMLVPRVERIPVPQSAPAPRVEMPAPAVQKPVKAAMGRAVFTRSAILRGDLVSENPGVTRLAAKEPQTRPLANEIDTQLIRLAIAKMH